MKKKTIITIIFAIMLLTVPFVHAADNQFQDIIDLVGDVFVMVGTIFALPFLQEPEIAFGLILFLFWLAIFSAIFYGLDSAFSGMNKRLRTIIAIVPATIFVILMNFETDFFVAILGGWLIPVIMLIIYGLAILVIRRLFQMDDGPWAHLARAVALIAFSLLLMGMSLENVAEFIEEVASYKMFMLPYFFKIIINKYEKWR